mmetsp:Transcript_22664/g.63202  ORF Transcript_22664/g.63202 Transcript_22664/m.63202 type:complete len:314 (+) Transcript_22664:618-1559(+)
MVSSMKRALPCVILNTNSFNASGTCGADKPMLLLMYSTMFVSDKGSRRMYESDGITRHTLLGHVSSVWVMASTTINGYLFFARASAISPSSRARAQTIVSSSSSSPLELANTFDPDRIDNIHVTGRSSSSRPTNLCTKSTPRWQRLCSSASRRYHSSDARLRSGPSSASKWSLSAFAKSASAALSSAGSALSLWRQAATTERNNSSMGLNFGPGLQSCVPKTGIAEFSLKVSITTCSVNSVAPMPMPPLIVRTPPFRRMPSNFDCKSCFASQLPTSSTFDLPPRAWLTGGHGKTMLPSGRKPMASLGPTRCGS